MSSVRKNSRYGNVLRAIAFHVRSRQYDAEFELTVVEFHAPTEHKLLVVGDGLPFVDSGSASAASSFAPPPSAYTKIVRLVDFVDYNDVVGNKGEDVEVVGTDSNALPSVNYKTLKYFYFNSILSYNFKLGIF
ncbi:hypothetical protein WA026_018471 [Henosepilachna vigintioctopunctata]|uniref:Uncharacterized protein n=1 Tax=Henosepilachna vigintioctopunctata TaxID=420089 RepID=A0AAW1UUJ7_9CUCU